MLDVALVGCGKDKHDGSRRAFDLYKGNLTRAALSHAARNHAHVAILSAKYGLLLPDDVVDSYTLKLDQLSCPERCAWAAQVVARLDQLTSGSPARFTIYAGKPYIETLVNHPAFRRHPEWEYADPLRGLEVGQRLSWFKARR